MDHAPWALLSPVNLSTELVVPTIIQDPPCDVTNAPHSPLKAREFGNVHLMARESNRVEKGPQQKLAAATSHEPCKRPVLACLPPLRFHPAPARV
jgi:hypothetical protein